MTLTEFLLDRIAEDEAVAGRLAAEGIAVEGGRVLRMPYVGGELVGDARPYLTDSWNPARVLAECDAKRRIVATHEPYEHGLYGLLCEACAGGQGEGMDWPCLTLRALVLPYADHPDFDPSWAPDAAG